MLCKDCKYFRINPKHSGINQIKYGFCHHPSSAKHISYHTGHVAYKYAHEMRKPSLCGTLDPRYFIHQDDITPCKELDVKFCADCKYLKLDKDWLTFDNQLEFARCAHPWSTVIDVVDGAPVYEMTKEMRKNKSSVGIDELYLCGTNALFHEPSNNTHIIERLPKTHSRSNNDSDARKQRIFLALLLVFVFILLML